MEEESSSSNWKNKNPPAIPVNYVSLLQLKEQWMKEKERKEKEEEELREKQNQKQQQQQQQQRQREEEQKLEPTRQQKEKRNNVKGFRRRAPIPKDQRNLRRDYGLKQSENGGKAVETRIGKPGKPEFAEIVVAPVSESGEKEVKESKVKKRVRKGSRKNKDNQSRVKENAVGGGIREPPLKSEEKNMLVGKEEEIVPEHALEKVRKKSGKRKDNQARVKENAVGGGIREPPLKKEEKNMRVSKEEEIASEYAVEDGSTSTGGNAVTPQTVLIERKIKNFSISGGERRGNHRPFSRSNSRSDGNVNRRNWNDKKVNPYNKKQNPTNTGMIWVKKREATEVSCGNSVS